MRLPENVEYLEELKRLAETEGVLSQVKFLTSCPTAERNSLLSECICVIYTPKVTKFHTCVTFNPAEMKLLTFPISGTRLVSFPLFIF